MPEIREKYREIHRDIDGKEEPSKKNEKRESNNEKDLKERNNCEGMVVVLIGRCGE
jgi:hypothetical protein